MFQFRFTLETTELLFLQDLLLTLLLVLRDGRSAIVLPELIGPGLGCRRWIDSRGTRPYGPAHKDSAEEPKEDIAHMTLRVRHIAIIILQYMTGLAVHSF